MLIWAESFDYYGTGATGNGGRDYMLSGLWAAFNWGNGTAPAISSTQARTGTYSLKIEYNSLATEAPRARRVLGASELSVGCGFGVYFDAIPDTNGGWGFEFRNNSNVNVLFVAVQSDGAIALYSGSGHTLIAASDPVITANAWQHIEAKILVDNIVGACEVRVNGVTVLNETNLDLGTDGITQLSFGMPNGKVGNNNIAYFDDIVTWDDTGDHNNDFLGAVRVETLWANADTAQADFTPTGDTDGLTV